MQSRKAQIFESVFAFTSNNIALILVWIKFKYEKRYEKTIYDDFRGGRGICADGGLRHAGDEHDEHDEYDNHDG